MFVGAHVSVRPCICDGGWRGKKKYFENISLKMPSVFFYRALVLIPSYCWLTEGYTDSAAEVDVAVLAG